MPMSWPCKLSSLQTVIFQTVTFLSCKLSFCKLSSCILPSVYLVNFPLFILQIAYFLFSVRPWDTGSSLVEWRWIWRAPPRLRLTLMGSLLMRWVKILLSFCFVLFCFFFCMFPRVLLTLCVATGHIESFGRCNFCYGSCLGNGYPHYF